MDCLPERRGAALPERVEWIPVFARVCDQEWRRSPRPETMTTVSGSPLVGNPTLGRHSLIGLMKLKPRLVAGALTPTTAQTLQIHVRPGYDKTSFELTHSANRQAV